MQNDEIKEIVAKLTQKDGIQPIISELIKSVVSSFLNIKTGYRNATDFEKELIVQAITEKKFNVLKDLYLQKVDLNSIFFEIDGLITQIFFLATNYTDEEYVELINVLNDCDYNFEIRNYGTGSSALLSMILTFKYKTAKRLIELGVDVNTTNLTGNRTLTSVYSASELPDEVIEIHQQLGNDITNLEKDEELIEMIKNAGYDDNASDPLLAELNQFVSCFCEENNYDENLKHALLESVFLASSRAFLDMIYSKFGQ